MRSAAAMF